MFRCHLPMPVPLVRPNPLLPLLVAVATLLAYPDVAADRANPPGGGTANGELAAPGFHHIHLNAADPGAEIAFYTQHFPSTTRGELFGSPAVKAGPLWVVITKVPKPPATQ